MMTAPTAVDRILYRFWYVVALARVRASDDWRSILAAIPQDDAAKAASKAEATR